MASTKRSPASAEDAAGLGDATGWLADCCAKHSPPRRFSQPNKRRHIDVADVYLGNRHIGTVEQRGFLALTADGHITGEFSTENDAVQALTARTRVLP